MNEFKFFHPIVNFIYFLFAIVFSCIFLHPVTLAVSSVVGFIYSVMLKGTQTIKNKLLVVFPTFLLMTIINPAFNHAGVTIIAYLPSGNPITFESILYGLISATMIISVVFHFLCFNEVMTSDKLIYLFGKVAPILSLIFSMVLRFVPQFTEQTKIVADSQKCLGRDVSNGSIINRVKNGLTILSIIVTWSLEIAMDTSDSMKSRGYGLGGRTAFSIFKFTARDKKALFIIMCLAAYVIIGSIMGELKFVCFPIIQISDFSLYSISVFVAYIVLLAMPIIIEFLETRKWKYIK